MIVEFLEGEETCIDVKKDVNMFFKFYTCKYRGKANITDVNNV